MQIVHGQTVGLHCFILVTNDKIEWSSLISIGNKFQIMEPKYIKEFLPLRTEYNEDIKSLGLDHTFLELSLVTNNSFKLFPDLSWRTL